MFKIGASNKALQELLNAEKAVIASLERLSADCGRATEALRLWGASEGLGPLSEGDDLRDIAEASAKLLSHFLSALSQYASHGSTIREQLKAIRAREQALEAIEDRQRTLSRKRDDADKKLVRMEQENHKNVATQRTTLDQLRTELARANSELVVEGAATYDFKRSTTRIWMGLKFGGLLQLCEKGTIIAEYGKMTISEIPEVLSQPGQKKIKYEGNSRTKVYVEEAEECIAEVVLATVPSVGFRDRRHYEQLYREQEHGLEALAHSHSPIDTRNPLDDDVPTTAANMSPPISPVRAEAPAPPVRRQTVDDLGVISRSPTDDSTGRASGFATFPGPRNSVAMG